MSILVSGIGVVTAGDLTPLAQNAPGAFAPRSDWPEITLIDVPEGAPEIACECADFNLANEVPTKYPFIDRCSALALGAVARCLKDAGLGIERTRTENIGLSFASRWGCLDAMRTFYEKIKEGKPQHSSPLPFSHSFANSPSSLIAIEFGLHGFASTWAGGNNCAVAALQSALGALESGVADRMLVVASDAISHGTFHHYWATGKLAQDGEAAARSEGFVLAEGAVAILLESAAAFATRNRPPAPLFAGLYSFNHPKEVAAWFAQQEIESLWLELPECRSPGSAMATVRQSSGVADVRMAQPVTGNAMSVSPLLALVLAARSARVQPSLVSTVDFLHESLFGCCPAGWKLPAARGRKPSRKGGAA